MHTELTYDEARANLERVLIKGRRYKADVFITRSAGQRFVVKDFSQKGFWERNFVGRIVINREAGAYEALKGVAGLPSHFKRLSSFAVAVEYLEGRDLGSVAPGEHWVGVISQFEQIIHALHSRGWVHLDLHRRTNILLVDGKVYVVDLASALHTGNIPLIGRCFTRLVGFADRLSLIKMKAIFAQGNLTAQERRILRIRNICMPTKWRPD